MGAAFPGKLYPGRVLHRAVSKCQVSSVTASGAKPESEPIKREITDLPVVCVPVAIGNAVARTKVMETPALPDLLLPKEQV
jgi:hypothetical protein